MTIASQLALNFVKSATPCGDLKPTEPINYEYGQDDPKAYALMQQALAASDQTAATDLWKQAEKLLGANVPKVPIVWAGSAIAVSNKIHGFVPSAAQAEYFAPASR